METLLRQGLTALGLPADAAPALARYGALLIETNKVMNLTAITEPADVAALHFLDSAALLTLEDFRGKSVADVGTGAGFPGLPLKDPGAHHPLTLLDALQKRVSSWRPCAGSWASRTWRASTAGRRSSPQTGGRPLTSSPPGRWPTSGARGAVPAPGAGGRPVPGHEVRGLRRRAGGRPAGHRDPGRARGSGPGLRHSRHPGAAPADHRGKSEKNSGKISENICKNQEESLIIHL